MIALLVERRKAKFRAIARRAEQRMRIALLVERKPGGLLYA
jgi:hypothetical protein